MTRKQAAIISLFFAAYAIACLLITSAPYLFAIWLVRECSR